MCDACDSYEKNSFNKLLIFKNMIKESTSQVI
jgi:hypothetical protein